MKAFKGRIKANQNLSNTFNFVLDINLKEFK
jgi:hypothetical protein